MGIRSVVAAAVVAVGIGQAAEAATLADINVKLTYEGTYYGIGYIEFNAIGFEHEAYVVNFGGYLADGNDLGIPIFSDSLSIGDDTVFTTSISIPDNQNQVISYFDNGGRASSCFVSDVECQPVTSVYYTSGVYGLSLLMGEHRRIDSGLYSGDELLFTFNIARYSSLKFDWGAIYFTHRYAKFTLLEDVSSLTPSVPLPAGAALLPVGIGALALVRRRRKVN